MGLYIVILCDRFGRTKSRVLITARNEYDAQNRALDEWSGDCVQLVEFVCDTTDDVNKSI